MKPSDLSPDDAEELLRTANGLVRKWFSPQPGIDFDDIASAGVLKALERIGRYDPSRAARLHTFLLATAKYEFKTERQRQIPGPRGAKDRYEFISSDAVTPTGELLLDLLLQAPDRAEDLAESNELKRALAEALKSLSAEARLAIWLKHVENWSADEIGELLGRTRHAVHMFTSTNMKKLRLHPALTDFAPEGYEFPKPDESLMVASCPSCGLPRERSAKRVKCVGCGTPLWRSAHSTTSNASSLGSIGDD